MPSCRSQSAETRRVEVVNGVRRKSEGLRVLTGSRGVCRGLCGRECGGLRKAGVADDANEGGWPRERPRKVIGGWSTDLVGHTHGLGVYTC